MSKAARLPFFSLSHCFSFRVCLCLLHLVFVHQPVCVEDYFSPSIFAQSVKQLEEFLDLSHLHQSARQHPSHPLIDLSQSATQSAPNRAVKSAANKSRLDR